MTSDLFNTTVTIGPILPLITATVAVPELHQTSHSCKLRHLWEIE